MAKKNWTVLKNQLDYFSRCTPDTILYEVKGYNHGYLSAYLPQEWIVGCSIFWRIAIDYTY